MTPMLATIRFESAYLLCHVNTIDAHSIWFALNAYRKPDYNELHVNGPYSYGTTSTSYSLTSNYVPVVAWSDQDVWLELFLLPKMCVQVQALANEYCHWGGNCTGGMTRGSQMRGTDNSCSCWLPLFLNSNFTLRCTILADSFLLSRGAGSPEWMHLLINIH